MTPEEAWATVRDEGDSRLPGDVSLRELRRKQKAIERKLSVANHNLAKTQAELAALEEYERTGLLILDESTAETLMLVADLEGMGFATVSVRANGKVGVGLTESGFKELYETDSELARHFLKVFPNRSIWEP